MFNNVPRSTAFAARKSFRGPRRRSAGPQLGTLAAGTLTGRAGGGPWGPAGGARGIATARRVTRRHHAGRVFDEETFECRDVGNERSRRRGARLARSGAPSPEAGRGT